MWESSHPCICCYDDAEWLFAGVVASDRPLDEEEGLDVYSQQRHELPRKEVETMLGEIDSNLSEKVRMDILREKVRERYCK